MRLSVINGAGNVSVSLYTPFVTIGVDGCQLTVAPRARLPLLRPVPPFHVPPFHGRCAAGRHANRRLANRRLTNVLAMYRSNEIPSS